MTASVVSRNHLEKLSEFVSCRMGLNFPEERWSDLERGITSAAKELGYKDADSYVERLISSPLTKKEIEILAGRLTVGETYFFRDKRAFEALEKQILPELIKKRRDSGKYLRIWSAGCATGEEPYSVAILLRRLIPDIKNWIITILATDINASFLEKASKGIYGEWSFRDTPSWVREGSFKEAGKGRFEIIPEVRTGVTFSYHNLAEDVYPSFANNTNAMDIILCRNVLMYFTGEKQRKVIEGLYRCLVDGGWLLVGPVEMSAPQSSLFSQAQFSGVALYSRKGSAGRQMPPYCDYVSRGAPEAVKHIVGTVGTELSAPPVPGHLPSTVGNPDLRPSTSERRFDLYDEALSLFQGGCYADAEKKISSLLAFDNNNGAALALLSRICGNRGQLAEARDLCERAIAADRINPAYPYLLAAIMLEMGREGESEICLNRALYLDQDFALAHFALGNLARRKGLKRESERHFKNALSVLRKFRPGDIVPESDGITAERMIEIIDGSMPEKPWDE